MNPYSGDIYDTPEAVAAAEARGEPLLYGSRELLEEVRPVLLMNRAARRREARRVAREERKKK